MRLARVSNGLTMDRDVIGAIDIGLKYLKPDGRSVAFLRQNLIECGRSY